MAAMPAESSKANAPCPLGAEPTFPAEVAVAEQAPVLNEESAIREQDRLMPVANVVRLMRHKLPPHAKIADDAKDLIQECVSEFISFVTGEANDHCRSEHRKTVTADDIVWAMARLGFDDYVTPLTTFVRRMRESEVAAGGGGRGSGRGDHARLRAPRAPPSVPVGAPLHAVHVQMHHPAAVYARPHAPPAQAYGVPYVPPNAPPHYAVPAYGMLGGDRPMAAYYGAPAFVKAGGGGHEGGCSDEASSSNEVAPAAGAGSQ
ncbi:hypothetical protein ACP70R_047218 [Stipagrostis hirtigluma subsp. patula]